MGQLIPLVKPDARAEGVAALSTWLTGLVLHVQKFPGFARKGWNTEKEQGWGGEAAATRRSRQPVGTLKRGAEDQDPEV